jgi:SPP1 family predicted phage head-tail adaptor
MLQSKEQIGKMDRLITFQYKDTERNRGNEPEEVGWIDYAVNIWARVEEKSGNEEYRSDKLTAWTIADFYIRFRSGIKEGMRILYNSRIYGITAIIFVDRKRYIKITAESGGEYVESSDTGGFSTGYDDGYEVDS